MGLLAKEIKRGNGGNLNLSSLKCLLYVCMITIHINVICGKSLMTQQNLLSYLLFIDFIQFLKSGIQLWLDDIKYVNKCSIWSLEPLKLWFKFIPNINRRTKRVLVSHAHNAWQTGKSLLLPIIWHFLNCTLKTKMQNLNFNESKIPACRI